VHNPRINKRISCKDQTPSVAPAVNIFEEWRLEVLVDDPRAEQPAEFSAAGGNRLGRASVQDGERRRLGGAGGVAVGRAACEEVSPGRVDGGREALELSEGEGERVDAHAEGGGRVLCELDRLAPRRLFGEERLETSGQALGQAAQVLRYRTEGGYTEGWVPWPGPWSGRPGPEIPKGEIRRGVSRGQALGQAAQVLRCRRGKPKRWVSWPVPWPGRLGPEIPKGDTVGLGPPKGASIDRLSGAGASAGDCLIPWGKRGVAAVLAVCCVRCGPCRLLCCCGGKHIISVGPVARPLVLRGIPAESVDGAPFVG